MTTSKAANFLETRKTISAESLIGPRVYSTDLLSSHLNNPDVDGSVLQAARALKIKLLTKGTVVLNSTHLVDPLGMKLCMAHQDPLFGDGLLPAFRVGDATIKMPTTNFAGYHAVGISENQVADHITWLERRITQVMPWEISDVGERLRERLIASLASDHSAIAKALSQLGADVKWRDKLIAAFTEMDMSRDRHLQGYVASLPETIRDAVSTFCQASYHAVGTTVVNCEVGTDLSPLSKFKADSILLANRDTLESELTDESIFLKVFLGYALNQIQSYFIPTQIIDLIPFSDVHRISKTLRHQGFQEKYERILHTAIRTGVCGDALQTLEQIDFEEVGDVSRKLASAFQAYLDEEFGHYVPREADLATSELMEVTADLGMDVLGLIPGAGSVVSAAKMTFNAAKVPALTISALNSGESEKGFAAAGRRRQEEISGVINRLHVSKQKQSQLLDAAAALSDICTLRIQRA